MTPISELELAFLENLRLLGLPAPHVIYLLRLRELTDDMKAWQVSAELGLAGRDVLNEAYTTAQEAVEAAGTAQAFSFSEGATIGPWELVQPKGRDVSGEAWIARQGSQRAFVRVLLAGSGRDPERTQRFVERSNPGLEPPHPSILRIDEAAEDFGWLYTASRGFEGGTLAEILGRGPLAEQSAVALAQSMAGSLQVVHSLGVVHGGLGPLAVLVHQSRTFLSDFGLSSGVLDGPATGSRPGGRLGALLYASPGLMAGTAARGLESRDDLYALGAIVYHALLVPNRGGAPAAPDAPWLVEPPISPGLRAVLLRLLSPHPDGRYPSAQALLPDLARVAQGQLPGPLPPPTPPVVSRRAPSAAPQLLLTAARIRGEEEPEGVEVEVAVEAAAEDEPAEAGGPAAGKSDRLKAGKSDRLKAGKSDRLKAGKSDRQKAVSSGTGKALARRASDRFASEPKAKGPGWGWLAGAMVLVGGGLVAAVFLTKPQGPGLGRHELLRAAQLAQGGAPEWDEALAHVDRALAAAPSDPQLLHDAVALRQELLRRAEAEVTAALATAAPSSEQGAGEQAPGDQAPGDQAPGDQGPGDQAPGDPQGGKTGPAPGAPSGQEAALLALRERVTGTRLEPLIDLQLSRLRDLKDLIAWGRLGDQLYQAGWARQAAEAYLKAGRDTDHRQARVAAAMAYVPAGPYLVPPEEGEGVVLSRREASYLGRTEVTRGEYRDFMASRAGLADPHQSCDKREGEAKVHTPDGWRLEHGPDDGLPATGLDWWDAFAFCRWRGGLLPEPGTLQAAARGPLLRAFPWGALAPGLAFANCGGQLGDLAPCGSFPAGAGVGGALDLLGNAEEWGDGGPTQVSLAPVWGGSWETPPDQLSAAAVAQLPVTERRANLGFRVAIPLGESAASGN